MAKYQRENPASPIPLLYRTLDDAQHWESALNALAEDLGADHIVLDLQADLAPMIVATRVAPNHIAQFASHHEYRQLRGLVTHSTSGCTLRGESIIDQRLQARSEFYADVIRPMGGYHALFALTSRAAGRQTALLSACRSSRKRGFESRHLEKLDAFLPHLETVIRLQRRITHSAVENWWHETILKALPVGIILLDAQGKPCYINPAAESLLDNTSALSLSARSGLNARDPATQRQLSQAIEQALGKNDEPAPVAIRLHSRQDKQDVWLRIAPLPTGGGAIDEWSPARVLVFCDGPDSQSLNPAELSRIFGFSPRESALAQALIDGQPLADAAGSLGVSHETVRSQLKSLFAKTDTNRQAELTAVLNKLRRWSGP